MVAGEILLGRGAGGMGFRAEEMMRAGCAQLLLQESTWKGKKQPSMDEKGLCWTLRHSQGSTRSSQLRAWTWGAQPWVLLPRDTNAAPAAGGSMSAGRRRRERGGQVLTSVCRRSRADELCFPHFVMLLQTGMLPPPVGIGAPACALLSRHLPNPAEIDYSLRFNDSAFLLLLIY